MAQSNRADAVALERFCTHFHFEPVFFEARDAGGQRIYHTNLMMCVGTDVVLIALEAITDTSRRSEVRHRLEATGRKVIDLTLDQIGAFAGNALQLQGREGPILAISARPHRALDPAQISDIGRRVRIVSFDVPTIERAGGSVRCMLAGIHLTTRQAVASHPGPS